MDLTERERLLGLLTEWVGPKAAEWHWSHPRKAWGGLNAQELWELGCHESLRDWVFENVRVFYGQ